MRPLTNWILPALLLGALAVATPAWAGPQADPEGGGADDIEAQIKAQMDKIIRLMEQNEEALLELSASQKAEPKAVDVKVPDPNEGSSSSAGQSAAEKLEKLVRQQRQSGGTIPGELEELVRMVPL